MKIENGDREQYFFSWTGKGGILIKIMHSMRFNVIIIIAKYIILIGMDRNLVLC